VAAEAEEHDVERGEWKGQSMNKYLRIALGITFAANLYVTARLVLWTELVAKNYMVALQKSDVCQKYAGYFQLATATNDLRMMSLWVREADAACSEKYAAWDRYERERRKYRKLITLGLEK
jgi:hypothetical protein